MNSKKVKTHKKEDGYNWFTIDNEKGNNDNKIIIMKININNYCDFIISRDIYKYEKHGNNKKKLIIIIIAIIIIACLIIFIIVYFVIYKKNKNKNFDIKNIEDGGKLFENDDLSVVTPKEDIYDYNNDNDNDTNDNNNINNIELVNKKRKFNQFNDKNIEQKDFQDNNNIAAPPINQNYK